MTVTLFGATPDSIAIAPHIALIEAGIAFDLRLLDYKVTEQRSATYLKLNPKGRVPALVTERGVITETPAILTYIAQSKPEANLLPPLADIFRFAEVQSFMAYLCSTVHPHHAHRLRGARWSDDPAVIEGLKAKVPHNMLECFRFISDNYALDPWVFGAQYTITDCYLYAVERWIEADGVDPQAVPNIKRHRDAMEARVAVKKALSAYA